MQKHMHELRYLGPMLSLPGKMQSECVLHALQFQPQLGALLSKARPLAARPIAITIPLMIKSTCVTKSAAKKCARAYGVCHALVLHTC
jgi:hypothetical protein